MNTLLSAALDNNNTISSTSPNKTTQENKKQKSSPTVETIHSNINNLTDVSNTNHLKELYRSTVGTITPLQNNLSIWVKNQIMPKITDDDGIIVFGPFKDAIVITVVITDEHTLQYLSSVYKESLSKTSNLHMKVMVESGYVRINRLAFDNLFPELSCAVHQLQMWRREDVYASFVKDAKCVALHNDIRPFQYNVISNHILDPCLYPTVETDDHSYYQKILRIRMSQLMKYLERNPLIMERLGLLNVGDALESGFRTPTQQSPAKSI